ncbi:unnamed protein product [Candida verbasci]|uniref:Vacuolar membrane-associated protein IML1 n=1 Tax=Candida verbasci TaxID=1227364 RepID=A0A9W4TUZ4_9ASCO|nr:unnamed protein product [Candida verbasci]
MSANHLSLTVGNSKNNISTNSQQYLNKKIGNTITIGKKKEQIEREPENLSKVLSNQDDASRDPVQLTLWFHDLRTNHQDVIIDSNAIPGGVQIGQVFELQSIEAGTSSKKFIFKVNSENLRDNQEVDIDSKSKFQISLNSTPLQKLLDIPPRSQVQIKKITKLESIELDSVEIFIKDVNLSRDGMWCFSSSLVGTCGYIDQRVSYLNSRIGVIKYIYKNGRTVFSGYISKKTKIIYRSESAKLTVLIQLSREMWHFEENGEIIFHKLVNNLFPKIFRRWRDKGTHHAITIVLFTSIDLTDIPWITLAAGERPPKRKDYYRVVVDQVNIMHWDRIMANLRLEFANFKRDIMLNPDSDSKFVMQGQSLPSIKGNNLEAINVGLALLNDRFRNTDLKHSLSHFMLITPGTGLYDVDYDLLLETSKKISSIDTSVDIICLSQPPLHVTPLFRFIREGKVCHCVPNWCDISFYKEHSTGNAIDNQWIPRCKIYELQMMGVMENEVNDVKISRFLNPKSEKAYLEIMDSYDENVFKPVKRNKVDNISFDIKVDEPKFKAPLVKDATATLSLILNKRTVLPPDSSATTSSAIGTVTNAGIETSALSSLYNINKNSEDKRSTTHIATSSIETYRKGAGSPRIIKGETLFTKKESPKQSSKIVSPLPLRSYPLEEKLPRNNSKKKSSLVSEPEVEPETTLFWTEVANPSRELSNNVLQMVSRWSNLFPDKVQRRNIIKWRSFQAPAALPITTGLFPSYSQLERDYTFQNYTVSLSWENYYELKTTTDLMREMIQLRLMLGFQICYGEKVKRAEADRKPFGNVESLIKYFPSNALGSTIYLTLDDEIHRIFCDYNGNVSVQLYRRSAKEDLFKITLGQNKIKPYFPLIRTRYADEYTPAQVDAIASQPQKYNWNQFDQVLAGFDDAMPEDKKEFHKMKFVIMPANIPKNAYFLTNENLTPEEIRLEGLSKLITVIKRGKYGLDKKRASKDYDERSELLFYTGNLYDFLTEEAQNYDITGTHPKLMISENMRLNKSIKLPDLITELTNEQTGLNLMDRTWHFKRHLQCFIGGEFTSWLVDNFEDIDTREEGATYAQNLMNRGLFRHVESRHAFIDGHYFYEFCEEYYKAQSRWFSKKEGSTTPKSNASPKVQDIPELPKITSSMNLPSEVSSMSDSLGKKRKKFVLSKAIKFDVDPLKKSYRPELMTVHYDRVHNPEHCYHIRLQWLNTTNRFIEDAITAWSRLCERHGLKLVETPWKELCMIPKLSPFHSFVEMKLSLSPWLDEEFVDDKILSSNKYYYHLYLLKKLEYLLDNRSTSFFSKENIDISYSWGKPSFQYAQFIHKTGYYIVELRDNGDFFMAPNNMHVTRLCSNLSAGSSDYESNSNAIHVDSQQIMLNFSLACKNPEFLRDIYKEAKSLWREEYFSQII